MLHEIPRLEDYDVSPLTGFLPDVLPLEKLPDPYYEPWETIARDLPMFVMTRRVRDYVDTKMPHLSTNRLNSEPEWRRACMILAFIAHAYVWAGDSPRDHLPESLADPWLATADHFGLPAISSYAGVCLWNFKTIYPGIDPEKWSLENLASLITFTGSYDEAWFYLVSTAIERQGAPCLTHGLDAIKACRENNAQAVVDNLQALAEAIDGITTTLARMFEMCDPHTFYFRIRPYLAGWKNMEDAGLPYGVRYGNEPEYRQISGGSNAQSSLIQALDILLNVEHHPTGHRKRTNGVLPTSKEPHKNKPLSADQSEKRNNFLVEMRSYMPRKHREFLEALIRVAHIRDYVLEHAETTPELVISYDACLAMLRTFRDKHIQVVSRYIIIQARKAQKMAATTTTSKPASSEVPEEQHAKTSSEPKREGLATSSSSQSTPRGTGGTALIPFLKQARDETGDPAVSSWGRRLLSDTSRVFDNPHTLPVLPVNNNTNNQTAGLKTEEPSSKSAFQKLRHAVLGSD